MIRTLFSLLPSLHQGKTATNKAPPTAPGGSQPTPAAFYRRSVTPERRCESRCDAIPIGTRLGGCLIWCGLWRRLLRRLWLLLLNFFDGQRECWPQLRVHFFHTLLQNAAKAAAQRGRAQDIMTALGSSCCHQVGECRPFRPGADDKHPPQFGPVDFLKRPYQKHAIAAFTELVPGKVRYEVSHFFCAFDPNQIQRACDQTRSPAAGDLGQNLCVSNPGETQDLSCERSRLFSRSGVHGDKGGYILCCGPHGSLPDTVNQCGENVVTPGQLELKSKPTRCNLEPACAPERRKQREVIFCLNIKHPVRVDGSARTQKILFAKSQQHIQRIALRKTPCRICESQAPSILAIDRIGNDDALRIGSAGSAIFELLCGAYIDWPSRPRSNTNSGRSRRMGFADQHKKAQTRSQKQPCKHFSKPTRPSVVEPR